MESSLLQNLPSSVFEGGLDEVNGAIELLAAVKVGGTDVYRQHSEHAANCAASFVDRVL